MPRLRHLLIAFALCLASPLQAQTLSLTFDDGLNPDTQPAAAEWNARLLAQLEQAGITAMVFPALVRTGPGSGTQLIADWSAAGHAVGNHTSGHRSLAANTVSLADFIEQVGEAQAHFGHLPGWQKRLRFPYLKEGNTAEKRDGMRAWLQANDYRPAPVSIDASDWYYDQVFSAWLALGDNAKAEQVKQAYIAHLLQRAGYYDQLAQQLLGRRPAHVLLLHTNQLNAAALPALTHAFQAAGWQFVSPLQAFDDALYQQQPDILPAGESLVWALAKAQGLPGLRYPAEDAQYEKPLLQAQGLLPATQAGP